MPKAAAVQTSTTTDLSATPTFQLIPLKDIAESPLNPRKEFDPKKLAELTQSVREKGVVVPVLVRPVDPTTHDGAAFELVYGHRRVRAASAAGLSAIPATVRELADDQVLEVALIENVSRADINALEEGEAYRQLVEKHGRTVEEIAAKVGKSRETVYARMKLAGLTGEPRRLVLDGTLAPSIGILIARLPTPKLQAEALEALDKRCGGLGGPGTLDEISARDALVVLGNINRPLSKPPFDKTAALANGPCLTCEKRTGAQPDLFLDTKGDHCLDGACWTAKANATAKAKRAEAQEAAEKKGLAVLTGGEAKKALGYSGGYVNLEAENQRDDKRRTWKALLGKDAPAPVIAIDSAGKAHQLVRAEDANKALKKAGKGKLAVGEVYGGEDAKKARADRELRERVGQKAVGLMAAKVVASKETPASFLRWVVPVLMEMSSEPELLERVKGVASMNEAKLRGLLFEVAVSDYARSVWDDYDAALVSVAKRLGVDLKALEKTERAAVEVEEKRAAEVKGSPMLEAIASAQKGVCRICKCSDAAPCKGGCAWVDENENLCTACVELEPEDRPHEKASTVKKKAARKVAAGRTSSGRLSLAAKKKGK